MRDTKKASSWVHKNIMIVDQTNDYQNYLVVFFFKLVLEYDLLDDELVSMKYKRNKWYYRIERFRSRVKIQNGNASFTSLNLQYSAGTWT